MLNENRYIILNSVFTFIFLVCIFIFWVNYSFHGNFWEPFMIGKMYGIPQLLSQIGMYPEWEAGWDGQFYYYQSIDPFGLNPDIYSHIDNPPYRYQRIAIPFIAYSISKILNLGITPPELYHLVQISIVSIGFCYLLIWLRNIGCNFVYAYVWLLGVLNSLLYGMPDMPADAVLIITLFYFYNKKLLHFILSATFLCLIKEGYAAFVFGAILYVLIKGPHFAYKNKATEIALISIPLAFLFAWSLYIRLHFGTFSFLSVPSSANLVDFPFFGFFKTAVLGGGAGMPLSNKIIRLVCFGVLIGVLFFTLKNVKHHKIAFISAPYALLVSSFGIAIWEDYGAFAKSIGSVIIIGFFLFDLKNTKYLKFAFVSFALLSFGRVAINGTNLHNFLCILGGG